MGKSPSPLAEQNTVPDVNEKLSHRLRGVSASAFHQGSQPNIFYTTSSHVATLLPPTAQQVHRRALYLVPVRQ